MAPPSILFKQYDSIGIGIRDTTTVFAANQLYVMVINRNSLTEPTTCTIGGVNWTHVGDVDDSYPSRVHVWSYRGISRTGFNVQFSGSPFWVSLTIYAIPGTATSISGIISATGSAIGDVTPPDPVDIPTLCFFNAHEAGFVSSQNPQYGEELFGEATNQWVTQAAQGSSVNDWQPTIWGAGYTPIGDLLPTYHNYYASPWSITHIGFDGVGWDWRRMPGVGWVELPPDGTPITAGAVSLTRRRHKVTAPALPYSVRGRPSE